MTEEISDAKLFDDAEDGEILEDGEIADDEDNTGQNAVPFNSVTDNAGSIKDEKENKESNQSEFGSVSFCRFAKERDDHFKTNKRKKKANKKRKLANGNDQKKMFRDQLNDSATSRELVDISQWLNDSSFDNVELSDEDEYNFDVLDFEVLMEILGCTADSGAFINVQPDQRRHLMLRIVKIMKNVNGNDSDTSRRFARLKRRTRDRKNSFNGSQSSNSNSAIGKAFKAVCKFYLEGKCHKGSDCNFSHDCTVPKRKDLCKFYLQGFCGKGDDCLFMHEEFPCKFFHTNTECYSGEKCRFSHAPLTDETRDILRNYLDSGTLPDDPKPFRPAVFPPNKKEDDVNEMDLMEFDSSFNYETELMLSKPRPVLLGNPSNRVKSSYYTWKWQQELKELEKSYTGLKKNLFCIDNVFAIPVKPPSPRIEDDEEEIEAQIQNYYSDMLDTDDLDEMVALQEIEEHKKQTQEEELIMKNKQSTPFETHSFSNNEQLSEEEKRLIEASAHDEDLRIMPGHMPIGGPFAMNISNAFDPPNYNPTSYFDNEPSTLKPFSAIDNENNSVTEPNYSEIGGSLSGASNDITPADVSNMVRHIRNGSIGKLELSQPSSSPTSKPEYRDPRLNRLKETNRMPTSPSHSNTSPNISSFSEDKSISKPFIKICSPNVVIDYKLALITISKINYSCYFDIYHGDNALKNDPRLKKFFSTTPPALLSNNSNTDLKSSNEPEGQYSIGKTDSSENLMTLPALNIPSAKKANTIIKPPVPSKILTPLELISSKSATDTGLVSRDPRIRSKEVDPRVESNRKSLDDNNAVLTTSTKPAEIEVNGANSNLIDANESNSGDSVDNLQTSESSTRCENTATSTGTATNDLSSIPSYAIAALPSTRSLFSSVSSNLLFSSYPVTDKLNSNSLSSTDSYSNSYENSHNNDLSENGTMIIDEEKDDVMLADNQFEAESSNTNSNDLNINNINSSKEGNTWPTNISNSIDSDNEMEIDLQRHNESEMDSENENELIIASSSEPEDNKDCDNGSTDSLPINNFSINC